MIAQDAIPSGAGGRLASFDFPAKLAAFAAVSLTAVIWDDPLMNVGLALATIGVCLAAGLTPRYLGRVAGFMSPLFGLLLVTHGFFNVHYVLRLLGRPTLTPVFSLPAAFPVIGGLTLSREGLWYAVAVIAKSLTLFLLAPLLLLTTDPNQLIVGLVRMRVPYSLAFAFTSMLRFFPLLLDELNSATEAQRLRGYALESMGPIARIGTYARVAIPIILSTLHRAQQTEVVLQSRGFPGGPGRTYLHAVKSGPGSTALLIASACVVVVVLVARLGWGIGAFAIAGMR